MMHRTSRIFPFDGTIQSKQNKTFIHWIFHTMDEKHISSCLKHSVRVHFRMTVVSGRSQLHTRIQKAGMCVHVFGKWKIGRGEWELLCGKLKTVNMQSTCAVNPPSVIDLLQYFGPVITMAGYDCLIVVAWRTSRALTQASEWYLVNKLPGLGALGL